MLGPALAQNSTVECIDLSRSGLTDDGAKSIASALSSGANSLDSVILNDNAIGETGCVALIEAAAGRSGKSALVKRLALGGNKGGDPAGVALAAALGFVREREREREKSRDEGMKKKKIGRRKYETGYQHQTR